LRRFAIEDSTTPMIAVSQLSPNNLMVWVRCGDGSNVAIGVDGNDWTLPLSGASDYTQRFPVSVQAGSARAVTVSCADASGTVQTVKRLVTSAPSATTATPVRLVWGGDVGGQNVCRSQNGGYRIFATMAGLKPDLFVGLGDMIYGDDTCLPIGRYGNAQIAGPPPASTRTEFQDHWRYNLSDPSLAALLATTTYFPVFDDHEALNDVGPQHDVRPDAPDVHLLPPARAAFLDYNPLALESPLFRAMRWGQHAELFFLDMRSYRDSNARPDDEQKSMLGAPQRHWLIESLQRSTATWKVVVSSVPLAIPTCHAERDCDGWANGDDATGFETELLGILQALKEARVRNLIFLTTDVHFGTGFRHEPFADDPEFVIHEFITGPLSAGIFPRRDVDPTLRSTRLFYHAPPTADAITNDADAQRWFNFGLLEFDSEGRVGVRVINALGDPVYEEVLAPAKGTAAGFP